MSEALAHFQRQRYYTWLVSNATGNQFLRFPVFRQDKIDYIRCLEEFVITTITFPVIESWNYPEDCLAEVR
jgi:hypothetical protein